MGLIYPIAETHSFVSEAAALSSGAILEAVVEKGEGTESPKERDLVYFHFTVHRLDEQETVVYSTRPENGTTNGSPLAVILAKAPRLPRAWEMTLVGQDSFNG